MKIEIVKIPCVVNLPMKPSISAEMVRGATPCCDDKVMTTLLTLSANNKIFIGNQKM